MYVLPGEYTLTLEGKNKAEIEVKQTIATLNAQAQKAYNINCDLSLPVLELPAQAAGRVWATHLYLETVITKVNGVTSNTPSGLIYEIKTQDSEWEKREIETLHEKKVISNLSAKTAYQLRARVGDIVSNEITITTEEKTMLETITLKNGRNYQNTSQEVVSSQEVNMILIVSIMSHI